MSAFWAGFAAEGVKQLDSMAEDKRYKDKLEEARKYNEERYSLERADKKADSLEGLNLELKLKEADDTTGIREVGPGLFMRDAKTVDGDGNITITPTQIKDESLISRWREDKAKKEANARQEALTTERAEIGLKTDKLKLDALPGQLRLENQKDLAAIGASNRSGRENGGKLPMPDHVDTIGKSLAKNKDVYFRSQKDTIAFKKLLARYGFKDGADLGRRYERGEERAILALDEGAEYVYFPSASEIDANTGKLKEKQ